MGTRLRSPNADAGIPASQKPVADQSVTKSDEALARDGGATKVSRETSGGVAPPIVIPDGE